MVVVGAAAGADGDVVEATRHQGVKDALGAGLGHGHGVQRPVVVAQRHQVAVHITRRRPPRHAEEVRLAVVADRHLAHRGGYWVGTRGGTDGGTEITFPVFLSVALGFGLFEDYF